MIAYSANGDQIGIVGTDPTPTGGTSQLTVVTGNRDIDYVVAYSIPEPGRGFGRLDNLQIEGIATEPTVVSDAQGNYSISPIANGDYELRMELADGLDNSLPTSGVYDLDLTGGTEITGRNFGVVDSDPATWHNSLNPIDVDADGAIVPLDVLLIINEINEPIHSDAITGRLVDPPATLPNAESRAYFFDVNDDGFVTASDAIEIINHLNNPPVAAIPALQSDKPDSSDARAAILLEVNSEDLEKREQLSEEDEAVVILLTMEQRPLII